MLNFNIIPAHILYLAILVLSFILFFTSLSFSIIISSQYLVLVGLTLLLTTAVLHSNHQRITLMLNSYLIFLTFFFLFETFFITPDDFNVKTKMVTVVKLLIFYIPVALLIFQYFLRNFIKKSDKVYLLYFTFLLLVIPINTISLVNKSAYLFNSFFVFLIIFFLLYKYPKIKISPNTILYTFLIASTIGIYLMFNIGIDWNHSFFHEFYQDSPFDLVNGLPRTWFTTFLNYPFFQRFNGILSDPIIYGFFTSMLVIIAINSKRYLIIFLPLLLFFLLYSFSKGAIYLVLVTLFLHILNIQFVYKRFIYWFVYILSLVAGNALISLGKGSSADIHFIGLLSPFKNIPLYTPLEVLFGHGYTSGGNIAKSLEIVTNSNWLATGAESGIGMIFYQTGFIGLTFIFYFFYTSTLGRRSFTKHFISVYFVLLFTQENLANMNYLVLFIFTIYVLESITPNKKEIYAK